MKGCRWLEAKDYRRVVALSGRQVISIGRRFRTASHGIGNRTDFEDHLKLGRCTHDEVRQVVARALLNPDHRAVLNGYLRKTVRALIVDEVFDSNPLDLNVISLAVDAGIETTIVGDPWQALYGFRGARPDLVPGLAASHGFVIWPVSRSFRFDTTETQQVADDLRAERGVKLPALRGRPDAVLASHWQTLWDGPKDVLPASFGPVGNQTDAALVLFLDYVLNQHFGSRAMYVGEAEVILRLTARPVGSAISMLFNPVVTALRGGTDVDAREALRLLRASMMTLGTPRRLRSLGASAEAKQTARLLALGARLARSPLVPGLTIHQAKGREWRTVGIILSAAERRQLEAGLSPDVDDHRRLYVGLTRARSEIGLVG
jgi:DNA helicase-2/ATP-dependent DNA helicase PcrA